MSDRLSSYPSIFQAGHRALGDMFAHPVTVEEKVDGSQFSFGVFGGTVQCRSKGKQLVYDDHGTVGDKMFDKAVDTARDLSQRLQDGWTYRCEYLRTPKHNTTSYARVPGKHVIVFDIETGPQQFLSYGHKAAEAAHLGLEVVPRLFEGVIESAEQLRALIPAESVLGGAKAEGVVAKCYTQFGLDKKILIAKCVRDGYAEENRLAFRVANPTRSDVVQRIIDTFKTVARWRKAVQHLRDASALLDAPQDIPAVMREIIADVERECKSDMIDALWAFAWPQIRRGLTKGAAEWYKAQLLDKVFESPDSDNQQMSPDSDTTPVPDGPGVPSQWDAALARGNAIEL